MNTKQIDILNIGLLLISLIVAFFIPFELFLFSYAILGPLHYLTEITWLRERNYFIKPNRKWSSILIGFAIIVSIYPIYSFVDFVNKKGLQDLFVFIGKQTYPLLLACFLFAVSLIFLKKAKQLLIAFFTILALSYTINYIVPKSLIILGLFLPTLIHVYLFTLLFVIYGAIKSKSRFGFYLAGVMLISPFLISLIPIDLFNNQPSNLVIETFKTSGMQFVSAMLANLLNISSLSQFELISEAGIKIQVFVAFAYTYHYLNWFSKTSIIGWKKALNRRNSLLILLIWIISVGIYVYDARTGFITLFFLSFLHVFLEFPLNAITIRELFLIGKKQKS